MAATNTRRTTRRRILLVAGATLLTSGIGSAAPPVHVEVWKDPNCGCCKDWIAHMEANGFKVTMHDTGNSTVRARLGIQAKYGSCHTAAVSGYAIEGHVPAGDIRRLLAERPEALGLAAPGMPVGSPGMDGPAYKGRRDAFDVLLLTRDGRARTYKHYDGNKT
jgi:hypothetical protein